MKKFILSSILVLSLSACVNTELSTQHSSYNPTTDARIRLYGQNGRPTLMLVNHQGKTEKVTIGGGLGQAFSSMIGTKDNESIGIPESELSKNPEVLDGIISSAFFKEFIIPANSEITVNNSIMGTQHRHNDTVFNRTVVFNFKGCSGQEVTFIPQAGKDYEVAPIGLTKGCGVTVYEIGK